ncbi:MAG: TPM domain-containing protein [Coriobacteriales bacterium]|nr:TPM domain-containing protein [Coriobacteriales bacterium]
MKLKKHLLLACLPFALLASLLFPGQAFAKMGTYVFDEMNVLTNSEFEELESAGSKFAEQYQVGAYLLITYGMGVDDEKSSPDERNEFARAYYLNNNLGVGPNKDGILLVIAVGSREYVTIKHFTNSSADPFSDDSVDDMESAVKDELSDNLWYEGADAYYENVGDYLSYFAEHGEQWESPNIIGPVIKIGATILVPVLIAYGVVRNNKNAMQTARRQTEAEDYLKPGSYALSAQSDVFVNRTITSTPRPKSKDNDDGGGWSDMGGGFSGSGGGDF